MGGENDEILAISRYPRACPWVSTKQILLITGEAISGETVWKSFRKNACCSKVTVRTNAKQVYQKYDYRTFTTHQFLFYGDHRQKVKDLAGLIGFEVIEEDRP